jgi:alpha-L-fucosidase
MPTQLLSILFEMFKFSGVTRRIRIVVLSSMLSGSAGLLATPGALAQTVDRGAAVGNTPARATYVPSQGNLDARKWFEDAKFGVFIHWGLSSQLSGVGGHEFSEWIMSDTPISVRRYERLAQFFNPSKFDAAAWVSSFKAAGAKYIVFTAKHHDGFAMYHSKVSSYNIVDATPFKRDPIEELSAACQKQGLKLFIYYSQLDWYSTDYFPRGATGQNTGRPNGGTTDRLAASGLTGGGISKGPRSKTVGSSKEHIGPYMLSSRRHSSSTTTIRHLSLEKIIKLLKRTSQAKMPKALTGPP